MLLNRNGYRWVAVLVVAALAVIGAPAAHAKSPLITAVKVSGKPGKLSVRVVATGQVQYRVLNLTDPRFNTVVEIFPAQLSTDIVKSVDVNTGLVEKVRVGQFSDNPDVVRLVLDVKALPKYEIVTAPGHKGLTLAVSTDVASAKASTANTTPAPAAAVQVHKAVTVPIPVHSAVTVTKTPSQSFSLSPALAHKARPTGVAEVTAPDISPTHTYVVHNSPKEPQEVAAAPRRRRGTRRGTYGGGGHKVSLDFVGADLIYVLKILAKELNYNLVTDSSVKGSVTMSLKDVPPFGALSLILKIAGFDYKIIDHTIVVGQPDTLGRIQSDIFGKPPPVPGQMGILPIPLEHAKAASIADSLKSVYPDVTVTVQADQNFVVVQGPKKELLDIKEFVQKMDVPPPPPVVLKTEVVAVKYATVQTILTLAKQLYPSLNYSFEERINSLIVTGQDRDIEQLKAFLAQVDIPLQQVMLDIRVVSLSEDASKQIGFTIGSSTGNFGVFAGTGGTPVTFTETFPNIPGTTTPNLSTGQLAISPFTRTPFVIGATLSLLVAKNDAKVISTPRVMTQSGKQASVLIGDKFPIVYFDPRAGQFQVQYVDIGVKLLVKPTVAADGFVTVDMAPEVSTLEGLINNQYPRTGITTVKTEVRVRDGDTIIVGGLLREIETYTLQKLPFLGDLPVLGEFFRNTSIDRTKSEVFITVTPKIMP